LSVTEESEYCPFALNIQRVTDFVTSSITVLQALLWEKLSVNDQIIKS